MMMKTVLDLLVMNDWRKADRCDCGNHLQFISITANTGTTTLKLKCMLCSKTKVILRKGVPNEQKEESGEDRRQAS